VCVVVVDGGGGWPSGARSREKGRGSERPRSDRAWRGKREGAGASTVNLPGHLASCQRGQLTWCATTTNVVILYCFGAYDAKNVVPNIKMLSQEVPSVMMVKSLRSL
jgi:hypothetical protein